MAKDMFRILLIVCCVSSENRLVSACGTLTWIWRDPIYTGVQFPAKELTTYESWKRSRFEFEIVMEP